MIEVLDEHADLRDEDLRAGGRRLARGVRDLVGHAAVDLVADPGEDRYRHARDLPRHLFGVERTEVGPRAAAAGEDDDVDLEAGELAERPHDAA